MLCLFSFFSVCVFNHLLLLQTFVVLFTYVFVNEVYMEDDDLQEEKKTIIQNLMKHQLISRLRSEIDQGKFSYRLSDELSFMPFFSSFYFKDLLIVSKQMISIGEFSRLSVGFAIDVQGIFQSLVSLPLYKIIEMRRKAYVETRLSTSTQ